MGTIFEELIRKSAELSNETAGEHFTPRDVIRLMADLLFIEDDDVLSKPGFGGQPPGVWCGDGGQRDSRAHGPRTNHRPTRRVKYSAIGDYKGSAAL
jgi:N-6 DNA Methylase